MNNLHRELAPVTEAAWDQIEEEARRTFELIQEVYVQCGYSVIELPRSSADARAGFILEQLKHDGVTT